jgi:hypothetical protein
VCYWGLNLGLQVLYRLSHAPNPFCFSCLSDRVSLYVPELASTVILLFMLCAQLA